MTDTTSESLVCSHRVRPLLVYTFQSQDEFRKENGTCMYAVIERTDDILNMQIRIKFHFLPVLGIFWCCHAGHREHHRVFSLSPLSSFPNPCTRVPETELHLYTINWFLLLASYSMKSISSKFFFPFPRSRNGDRLSRRLQLGIANAYSGKIDDGRNRANTLFRVSSTSPVDSAPPSPHAVLGRTPAARRFLIKITIIHSYMYSPTSYPRKSTRVYWNLLHLEFTSLDFSWTGFLT